MGVVEVKTVQCRCERCGHQWTPRVEEGLPTICPKCKSAYWNRPRKKVRAGKKQTDRSKGKKSTQDPAAS